MPETKPLIYTALLEAQQAMGPVNKEGRGNYGKYATLETVLDVIGEPLRTNGLTYTQPVEIRDGQPVVVTKLIHVVTGEMIESVYPLVSKDPQDPQKLGGSLTYARRYSLLALLGLAPEDDDGQLASQPKPAHATPQGARTKTPVCPVCGGEMWDNREGKRTGKANPKAPDFRCKDKNCDGVIWPPKPHDPKEDVASVSTWEEVESWAFDRLPEGER